ncbi:MAG: hypothetical protein HS111_13490 [Kofleriaceae bacterium]|nr:hypothetical protein [Kofleriaceae bacterium]MCL4227526.1 hypothetical protein [Myxococcales bacterium]
MHLIGEALHPRSGAATSQVGVASPPVQLERLDGDVPGYLEESGFGSLSSLRENERERATRADWPSVRGDEYVPDLGVPDAARPGMSPEEIGRTDLDVEFEDDLLRQRVEDASGALDIDPGLLAASLFAEDSNAGVWKKTTGKVASEGLGLDDWFNPVMGRYIKRILKERPELDFRYSDVKATGESWDTSTEKAGGAAKPRGLLDARKAVMAVAVYQKAQEQMLRDVIERERAANPRYPTLDSLSAEHRLVLLRLAFNAGVGHARTLYRKLAKGGDISRRGGTQRDRRNAPRTAVLHTARAIHLSQHVFGRAAEDYRP